MLNILIEVLSHFLLVCCHGYFLRPSSLHSGQMCPDPTFARMNASFPEARAKWASLVGILFVVQYAQRTSGRSSTQSPLCSPSFIFKILKIFLLVASTFPFAWGVSGMKSSSGCGASHTILEMNHNQIAFRCSCQMRVECHTKNDILPKELLHASSRDVH